MYSKALGTGAFVQATSEYTPNDPFDIGRCTVVQGFNHKFVYNLYMAYSPSVYKGQQGFAGRVLGGWSFAPIFTAGSGGPQFCNTQTDAQAFGSGDGANYFTTSSASSLVRHRLRELTTRTTRMVRLQ